MQYSTQVKPISYLKAHAAEVLANIAEASRVKPVADAVARLRARRSGG